MLNRIPSLLFLLLPFSIGQASDKDWQLQRDESGIRVMQQATKSGYAITRGSVEIASSADALITLMRESAACQRWLFACKKSQLVKQIDARKRLDYTVIDSPYFFADRDMYTYSELSYDRTTQTAIIRISGRETYDKGQAGRVRIKAIQGFWRMQKLPENKTAVLYQIYSNPQLVPSKYLNRYIAESVFSTLKNLAVVSKEARYRDAQLAELK